MPGARPSGPLSRLGGREVTNSPERGRRSTASRFAAYVELTHPGPVAFVLLATAGLSVALAPDAPLGDRLAILVTMLGAQVPIGVVNELVDQKIDAVTKPGKPIPSGRVSVGGAWLLLAAGVLMLAGGSLRLAAPAAVLAWAGCGVGVAYSLFFKRTLLAWLPYVVGLPLLPIWVATGHERYRVELLSAYPIGMFAAMSVQLAQSAGDVRADREAAIRSLTTVAGETRTMWLCLAAISLSALLVGAIGRDEPVVLVVAALTIVVAVGCATRYQRRPELVVERIFAVTATLVVVLAMAWVYAIGES